MGYKNICVSVKQKVTIEPTKQKRTRQGSKQITFSELYTRLMYIKPLLKNLILVVSLGTFALTAHAQWQWVDKDGRKVFSDRSPPAEIAEKDILKRPQGAVRIASMPVVAAQSPDAAAKPASAASAAASKASGPKITGKDAELEAKKKKAEAEEAGKKKVEEEKVAKAQAENCERAKTGLATLKSGVRIASVNAKGEREIFDDAKVAAESRRAQEVIDGSCK